MATSGRATATSVTRPDRYRLTGPTVAVDRRTAAVRGDLADVSLAETVFAPHYATPEIGRCGLAAAMLREGPGPAHRAVSQLLPGEAFAVLDIAGGWAWGYALHDRYVGYLPADRLAAPATASHVVTAVQAPLFAEPDIKSFVTATLPIGARVGGTMADGWLATAEGYLHHRHVQPADAGGEWVGFAERLVGLPYLWGGRGAGGIDCSGLVQLALGLAGTAAPRDSDQQRALGVPAEGPARRGDLVFFPGHVGIMLDDRRFLHANAHWMAVTIEPLADAVARLPGGEADVIARRRLS